MRSLAFMLPLSVLVAAGCMTNTAGDASVHHATIHPRHGCLADWNAAANRSIRAETMPPAGPYALYGGDRRASPSGRYEVFVGRSIVIGAVNTNPPPVCYVHFRFPHGYNGGPAMVSYPEVHPAAGVYGDPSITVGNDTDVGGRVFTQHPDGTLYPTPFRRG